MLTARLRPAPLRWFASDLAKAPKRRPSTRSALGSAALRAIALLAIFTPIAAKGRRAGLLAIALATLAMGGQAVAAEYFVAKHGDDAMDGLSRETAFRTVNRGFDALQPGDTLTIGPGEYFESVDRAFPGDADKPTLIRAEIPGTAWLRGDVDVSGFRPKPGSGLVWKIDWPHSVEAVNEVDTLTVYVRVFDLTSLEHTAGAWFHDEEAGILYVRTSASQDPARHRITVVKEGAFGLKLNDGNRATENVTVDGLVFSGFNSRDPQPWRPGHFTVWGLYLNRARNCTVRNVTAFLNGGGVAFSGAENSVIEDSRAYGNANITHGAGGGIVIYGPAKDSIIRRCVAHDMRQAGIRFYVSTLENCRIQDSVAWNNAYSDMWLKGTDVGGRNRYERCVAFGTIQSGYVYIRNSVAGHFQDMNLEKNDGFNLPRGAVRMNHDAVFADPGRLDYRPQAAAPFLGEAPDGGDKGLPFLGDLFFVKPDGDDAASGDSVANAWKTVEHAASRLQPGHTLYILPGDYAGDATVRLNGTAEDPILLRGRSGGPAVFQGGAYGLTLSDSAHVVLENLNWVGADRAGLRIAKAENIHVKNCGFDGPVGIESLDSPGLTLTHNALTAPLGVSARNAPRLHLAGNIFQGTVDLDEPSMRGIYSDYNSWGPDGGVRAGGRIHGLSEWRAASGQDTHSQAYRAEFAAPEEGRFYLADNSAFAGRGPLAMPIGPFHLRRQAPDVEFLDAGTLSLTATTANLEWGVNRAGSRFRLHWGEEPSVPSVLQVAGHRAMGNVGLSGLEPGRTYYFRVQSTMQPRWSFSQAEPSSGRTDTFSQVVQFTTPETEPETHVYHVATEGDNENDGLSPETAWRTVTHAAGRAKAGDTVLIHDGTYIEEIVVRGTGDTERPITFKNAPGARVVFSGIRRFPTVWTLTHKRNVVVDGFRFEEPGQGSMRGVIDIGDSSEILVQRCLYDGRRGNNPAFIRSWRTKGTTLLNNVMIAGFFGANISGCKDYAIKNNVFYINSVCALHVMRDQGARFTLENNILYDMIPMKVRNAFYFFNDGTGTYIDRYNCYYPRLPEDVKSIYTIGPERKRLTLEEFYEHTGQPATSFVANPGAPVLSALTTYASMEDFQNRKSIPGGSEFGHETYEFEDFFPTHPACLNADNDRPVGLDPEAFKHINP